METFCTPEEKLPDWAKPKVGGDPPECKANAFAAAKKTALTLGFTLLVFASLRNSVTSHFVDFWGASKDFYEESWNSIHQGWFGGNDLLLATFGTHGMLFVHYWLNALFFMALDTFRPPFFMKYKIQENTTLKTADLLKAVRVCVRNQFISLLLSFPLYFAMKSRQPIAAADLPSFYWLSFEMCVFILVEEIGFYYSHRLMHSRQFYKHIHKVHHEWTAPISIIGIYCHPVEHIVSNMMPIYMGPIIMGSHLCTLWLWICMALTSIQISHGGYHLPFLPSPEAHDFHHLKFTNNFGVMGVLDRFHGTDSEFIKTKAYERHFLLIGLSPAKVRFPDEEKKMVVGRS